MGNMLFNFFKKNKKSEPENGVILHFKERIYALRFEVYRNISIVYLSKPRLNDPDTNSTLTYHFFFKGEIQFADMANIGDQNENLEKLREEVVIKIDEFLA